jgi:hypothetical protein
MTSVIDLHSQLLGLFPKPMKYDTHVSRVRKGGRAVDYSTSVARDAILRFDDLEFKASV